MAAIFPFSSDQVAIIALIAFVVALVVTWASGGK
jgi:hypothetical protein